MGHLKRNHSAPARPLLTRGASRSPHTDEGGDPATGIGSRSRPREAPVPADTRLPRHRPTAGPAGGSSGRLARESPRPPAHQPVDLHLLDGRVSRGGGLAFALGSAEAAAGSARAFLARRHGCLRPETETRPPEAPARQRRCAAKRARAGTGRGARHGGGAGSGPGPARLGSARPARPGLPQSLGLGLGIGLGPAHPAGTAGRASLPPALRRVITL